MFRKGIQGMTRDCRVAEKTMHFLCQMMLGMHEEGVKGKKKAGTPSSQRILDL